MATATARLAAAGLAQNRTSPQSQRQLADAAGVPMSTVARIETAARQPSLITLSRLLAAADLELRIQVEDYDDHDDVLDARRAMLTDAQREQVDAGPAANSAVVARARAEGIRLGVIPTTASR